MTPEQLLAFQRQHVDFYGKPLTPDSQLGPLTEWALAVATLPAERRGVISRAVAFRGAFETDGPNRGPVLSMWQHFAGAGPGDPYCASALSWVLSGFVEPCAGALRLVESLERVRHPWPGDAWAYPVGDDGHGHCGLLLGLLPGEMLTWEANSGDLTGPRRRPLDTPGLFFGSPYPLKMPGVDARVPMARSRTR